MPVIAEKVEAKVEIDRRGLIYDLDGNLIGTMFMEPPKMSESVFPPAFLGVDKAQGKERTVITSRCRICGTEYEIESNAENSPRSDDKRIYPKGERENTLCSFRCRGCEAPVHSCVPGAEIGEGA